MDIHLIEKLIHISNNSGDLSASVTIANAEPNVPDWMVYKWNREISGKNFLIGSAYAYVGSGVSGVSGNSLFTFNVTELSPNAGTISYGYFQYDASGDVMPISSGSGELYFQYDGNSDIEPLAV